MSELKALDWVKSNAEHRKNCPDWRRPEGQDAYPDKCTCGLASLLTAPTPPQALMPEIKRYYMDGDGVAFESYDEHCPPGDWIRYADFQSYILGATPGEAGEKTCKGCLHFDGVSPRGWGSCNSDAVAKVTDTYDENGEASYPSVHQDFGCLHFEAEKPR